MFPVRPKTHLVPHAVSDKGQVIGVGKQTIKFYLYFLSDTSSATQRTGEPSDFICVQKAQEKFAT